MPIPVQCPLSFSRIFILLSMLFLVYAMLSILFAGPASVAAATASIAALGSATTTTTSSQSGLSPDASRKIDLNWYPPRKSAINDLDAVINGTGTHGFVFTSSQNPEGVPYGTYNWCNMPHVRRQEYPVADKEFSLVYVELIHRHHKRTPYASNTFPAEPYPWECSDEGLFFYGQPLDPSGNSSASAYWSVYTSSDNPFAPQGYNGTCQFPQITRQGLDDSWQHGKDLYSVYHDLLHFLPSEIPSKGVKYRVTNNVITSQVAGMVINGMYGLTTEAYPLLVQPDSIDSLEPLYSCPAAATAYSTYGVGGINPNWTAHLTASQPLTTRLDNVSGISADDSGWHESWDHYFDNLSASLCHQKPLPCSVTKPSLCVTSAEADEVFRLGEYEYSYIYRDAPQSLNASVAYYGVWVAELAAHLREVKYGKAGAGTDGMVYRHNIAHDGSISPLLSILQIDVMVWPGMGAEVVFEMFQKKSSGKYFVRILWGGQVMRSSNPMLGLVDMLPVETLLAYFDGLVGIGARLIPGLCTA